MTRESKSFIEVQFPVSKLSKECYKERKSAQGKALTLLGKWWGRKPLILVRAALLGLLIPASDNPVSDRDVFLKILTMDEDGLWQRKRASIPASVLVSSKALSDEAKSYLGQSASERDEHPQKKLPADIQNSLQREVFAGMEYGERLKYCRRPEEIEGPSQEAWNQINQHLGTHAGSLSELVHELGHQQFGQTPSVGDCFCGGGNIPFEAARLGYQVYASDLSPVAALLSWAAFHIIGGGEKTVSRVRKSQQEILTAVDRQICEWGIEQNDRGWRAFAYLFCTEITCPECGWRIPLINSLAVAERMQRVVAELKPNSEQKSYEIQIRSDATLDEVASARAAGTIVSSAFRCPNQACPAHTSPLSIEGLREGNLRKWQKNDIVPLPQDLFQERLYCIRWQETTINAMGKPTIRWHFLAPTKHDLRNEEKVFSLLCERFSDWQKRGYVPSVRIESGYNTDQPIRERGWTHWHHLFNPRQLLYHGLLMQESFKFSRSKEEYVAALLGIGRSIDWNSKLSPWDSSREQTKNTFYNQALNTLYNYSARSISFIAHSWLIPFRATYLNSNSLILASDARQITNSCSYWITDPPYADAINYHELSEFFLAWYGRALSGLFPSWGADSRRALAIRGSGDEFRKAMLETYRNLANRMPDNGAQIVMFTHQDVGVWADLALIIWAAGLKVAAAWCIQTETESGGLRVGNYVQGTVVLVLRKQTSHKTAFLDQVYLEVESEVKRQLSSMMALEDDEDPNFSDTDYQLAAYAAALRVLTGYHRIEEIDIAREISRVRTKGEENQIEQIIARAVKIACDYLVPRGIDAWVWNQLSPEERFYLRGLELESHGEFRSGAYQELARGFGIREYRSMLASGKANQTRLKTASEFQNQHLGDAGFGSSLVRNILFAVRQTAEEDDTAAGKVWLRELSNYWERRKDIIAILAYLASVGVTETMEGWGKDVKAARLLVAVVEQDHI